MGIERLTRQNLATHTAAVVRVADEARPEVKSVSLDGRDLVVKDYRDGKSPFGRLLGRFLIFREKTAYERLDGLDGIPRYYGTLDAYALILQQVPARPVTEVGAGQIPKDFFPRLSQLVESLHRRGIAHGDLHKLDNILIDEEGRPVILDFTSAIMSGSNPLVVLVFSLLCDDDWRGVYKLKRQVAPDRLTNREQEFLEHRSFCERVFRRVREPFRSAVKRWSSH